MAETVLVTGGTGYIAGWCLAGLLQQGYQVRTSLRSPDKEAGVRAALSGLGIDHHRLTFFIADLTRDEGWDAAMIGCDYVLHVASPLGLDAPQHLDDMVAPARDGTLRILRAATGAGVRRVVMTSAATVATPPLQSPDSLSDETVWFDPAETHVTPYRHAKRQAERAAWDFMARHEGPTTLTTVLPGAVFGPIMSRDTLGSVQVIARLLQGRAKGNPRLGFEVVDVRDLADLHIRAMTAPAAAGQRLLGVGRFMWMAEISQVLRDRLGDAAHKVPTRTIPDWLLRLLARFDPLLRGLTPNLGRAHRHSAEKARLLLGWQARPAEDTLIDCATGLIDHKAL
ncbi:NAD-dependent epimerase/dehydratase family protein [Pseudomonas sp. P7548]|uniref:NAD-dependent epimerase/dehydratase family protein n=1 Tax=Pseudomonas sp. P7548 TaxID=2726981 RepID=UPI0015B7F39A|nr:NAD-dependent epimerase/dehydratase family protein [Pseudomonas sp. P7548]NWE22076.1 NAD-dependent epimerase/dehydratase family protein [Pseudomonas sp. P7548]